MDMGKKKAQKTKEVSVAIAEASSTANDETLYQQPQIQTPRKRGRPRKIIIEKIIGIDTEDEKQQVIAEVAQEPQGGHIESQSNKAKTKAEEEEEELASASTRDKKKEQVKTEDKEPPRRSSRRKSKPRKSS